MKFVASIANAICQVVVTLQGNPVGGLLMFLFLLAAAGAGWTWRR